MFAEFLVSFREMFEIGLVLSIIYVYVRKNNPAMKNFVHFGVIFAVLLSILLAGILEAFSYLEEFEKNEDLFSGFMLLFAAIMVSWLNLWMLSYKDPKKHILEHIKAQNKDKIGFATIAFLAVFREGVEIVLFLKGIALSAGALNIFSVLFGFIFAILLSYAIFLKIFSLNIKTFFKIISIVLIFLAASLLSNGIYKLQEANIIPITFKVYDISEFIGQKNPDGTYPLFHQKGLIGSILHTTIGYSVSMSLEQALAYLIYIGFFLFYLKRLKYF